MGGGRRGRPVVALSQSFAERDQADPDAVTDAAQEGAPGRVSRPRSIRKDLGATVARMNL